MFTFKVGNVILERLILQIGLHVLVWNKGNVSYMLALWETGLLLIQFKLLSRGGFLTLDIFSHDVSFNENVVWPCRFERLTWRQNHYVKNLNRTNWPQRLAVISDGWSIYTCQLEASQDWILKLLATLPGIWLLNYLELARQRSFSINDDSNLM